MTRFVLTLSVITSWSFGALTMTNVSAGQEPDLFSLGTIFTETDLEKSETGSNDARTESMQLASLQQASANKKRPAISDEFDASTASNKDLQPSSRQDAHLIRCPTWRQLRNPSISC